MKSEFQNLKERLCSSNIYDETSGDRIYNEVEKLVDALGKKIDEVEKRMECARRSATEVTKTIGKFTESVDGGITITMSVTDHDVIERGGNDVVNALDLDDDMCVTDNWYGLFIPKPEVVWSFESSWGSIDCALDGTVIEVHGEKEIDGEINYLHNIVRVDIDEYGKFCESIGVTHGEALDILCVGFWKKDGTYEEHDKDWRENIRGSVEANIPPTALCQTPQTHEFVKDIIAKLKVIDVDGETMEYILEQVGMSEQMLSQLARKDVKETLKIIAE